MSYLSKIGSVAGVRAGIAVVNRPLRKCWLHARQMDLMLLSHIRRVPAPGDWQPTPPLFKPALDPGWGKVTPFLLRSGDQFRPAAPPALTSATYTADFNEIKSIGSATSTTRTADQPTIAKFWGSTGSQLWNQAPQQLVVTDRFTIVQAAHAFAALNLVSADAFIAAWDAKFAYNQWRPIMGIRDAAEDENPGTPDYPIRRHTL